MSNQEQKALNDFELEYAGPVKGSTGTIYDPSFKGDVAECQCEHAKHNTMDVRDKWCRHALELRNRVLDESTTMLRAMLTVKHDADAGRHLLQEVVENVVFYRNVESQIIASAYLTKAFVDGEVCADDIHPLVGHLIEGDSRINGSVVRALKSQGLLRVVEPPLRWSAVQGGKEVAAGTLHPRGGVCELESSSIPAGCKVVLHVPRQGKSSERTEKNHGREIKRYTITERGRAALLDQYQRKREIIKWPLQQ